MAAGLLQRGSYEPVDCLVTVALLPQHQGRECPHGWRLKPPRCWPLMLAGADSVLA